jgi:glutamate synthase (NADPH/NADH) small chain
LTDTAWDNGWVAPLRAGRSRGQSVGIIGAGPAGLAAAERLRALGYAVTVYDRHDRIGGLLVYGIPNFKLEKDVVARRAQRLIEGGVLFELNCDVGASVSFDSVRQQHDAVLIAAGVYEARPLSVPGSDNAIPALDYLIAANRVGLGDDVPAYAEGRLKAANKRVVVIGGGDTAMDCVRTAVRQGAASVTCLYRRDRANMPGSLREVACAEEEGVAFEWLAQPKALRGGKAPAVKAVRMRLGAADRSGRHTPEEIAGSDFSAGADLVIAALGFDAEDLPALWRAPQLDIGRGGGVKIDPLTYETSLPGVFAAGDVARGASLVVWALRDGREAAGAMHAWLKERAASACVAAE